MTAPLFTDPDHQLLENYWPDQPKTGKRRPPWTWSALTAPERLALTARIGDWVGTYNQCYAVAEDQLIPPCWPKHRWLAHELAVMTWLWYSAHRNPTATAERAGEFYRPLPPRFPHPTPPNSRPITRRMPKRPPPHHLAPRRRPASLQMVSGPRRRR